MISGEQFKKMADAVGYRDMPIKYPRFAAYRNHGIAGTGDRDWLSLVENGIAEEADDLKFSGSKNFSHYRLTTAGIQLLSEYLGCEIILV